MDKYEALLQRSSDLISHVFSDQIDVFEAIKELSLIKKLRQELFAAMKKETDELIYETAVRRAIDYIAHFVDTSRDKSFFDDIEEIRKNTYVELTQELLSKCSAIKEKTDKNEKQISKLIMERLNNMRVMLGSLPITGEKNKAIEWVVYDIDPIKNTVSVISKLPLAIKKYHESKCTNVEDESEACGCAETACSWKDSDIREFLNNDFYCSFFSDEEKQYIIEVEHNTNVGDSVIPNDKAKDKVFLIDTADYSKVRDTSLDSLPTQMYKYWWLREQERRGWDDTDESPKIYAVDCESGEITGVSSDTLCMVRPAITINLDYLLKLKGNNEMDELDNKIILNDENGNETEFEFLDLIEYNSEEYVVLLPCDETEDAGEVVILKLEDTDNEDEESYVSVDNEDDLNAIFAIFKDKYKDEFNFVD